MATDFKRITFTVTPDMVPLMDKAKQIFYDRTQSDMIRTLIVAGLETQNGKDQSGSPINHLTSEIP